MKCGYEEKLYHNIQFNSNSIYMSSNLLTNSSTNDIYALQWFIATLRNILQMSNVIHNHHQVSGSSHGGVLFSSLLLWTAVKKPDYRERLIGWGNTIGSGTSLTQGGHYCNSSIAIMVILTSYIYDYLRDLHLNVIVRTDCVHSICCLYQQSPFLIFFELVSKHTQEFFCSKPIQLIVHVVRILWWKIQYALEVWLDKYGQKPLNKWAHVPDTFDIYDLRWFLKPSGAYLR